MSRQFQITNDPNGDLTAQGGWAMTEGGTALRVGPVPEAPETDPQEAGDVDAPESDGRTYLGGSGRNLLVTGIPGAGGYNGVWRHGFPGKWSRKDLTLVHVSGGPTSITDGVDDLAVLASGGPVGSLTSTAYGAAELGSSFTAVVAAESGAPGVIPKCSITSEAGGIVPGEFTPTDAANFTFDGDPLMSISIAESGVASLIYDGTVIAIRPSGPNNDPAGDYFSTTAGEVFNPTPEIGDVAAGVSTSNPYGILTLVYSWPATPDLDDTTEFLDGHVGYPGPYLAPYMTHSGDDTSAAGSETVVIDLATAWDDGFLTDVADVVCKADWFPVGSSGTANLNVSYSVGGFTPVDIQIRPGNSSSGAKTVVAVLRMAADGTLTQLTAPWMATVKQIRVPTPAGVASLEIVRVAGVLSAVNGPRFDTTIPANFSGTSYFPIAASDGTWVEQMHTGMLLLKP